MILKLQRPINPADGPILAYDEKQHFFAHILWKDLPEPVQAALKVPLKVYFRAKHDEEGELVFGEQVEEQPW